MASRAAQHNRRAVVIALSVLAVVAMFFAASRLRAEHSVQPSNPVAPLVGAVDQAKATADAANRAAHQRDLQSGSPDVSDPASRTAAPTP